MTSRFCEAPGASLTGAAEAAVSAIGPAQPLDIALAFLVDVAKTLREKNAAYGNSALNPIRVFSRASSIEQLKVRIDDKISRISRGAGIDAMDEDVIKDLVGYLALYYEARHAK